MKKRTRLLALLLAACMTAGMAACGSDGAKTENKDTDTKKEAQNTEEKDGKRTIVDSMDREVEIPAEVDSICLLYTSPSPRD